ncbi:Toll/interleukin-1 receptor homology (TIR) domain [Arabidopsis thaliana x Arabidopsis arenosa]|uniref:Toll/interleukin-1 receptor homology (TIR) domain n=1 Tax=Arabidopsis thaliana x Arabidopsis arenosa TaxID=1240361 RepID=A0A8T1XEH6_9BRAS|nr:Toll/interleukin-1 receptor homology (TIR) domain [Arabidopsis thaliana x Arabidopsis arenosa]
MVTASDVKVGPEVFINFRGAELRKNFISHLHRRLQRDGINAFIDSDAPPGQEVKNLFKRIEDSKIALAVLSSRYTESHWCLQELVKMMECSTKGEGCNNKLLVIPIFYKLKISTVAELDGDFGRNLWDLWRLPGRGRDRDNRIVKWNEALQDVLSRNALVLPETGKEDDFLSTIVAHVKNALSQITPQRGQNPKSQKGGGGGGNPKPQKFLSRASNITEPEDQRLKQLEVKLNAECNDNETRIVGVVGMPGIGKTYLARKLFVKLKNKINHCVFIEFEREKSEEQGSEWLEKRLVEDLLDIKNCIDTNAPLEVWKDSLIDKKVTIVLDNVSEKKQIEPLLGRYDWIKKGSKIVITTRDKSLTEGLVSDLYEVPGLNERDGLELFRAQACCTLDGNFMDLSRKFVDYAGGNPLALEQFSKELRGKDVVHWETRLGTLAQCSNPTIREKLRSSYDELNEQQKDAFLDIAYFFRSQDESYVRSLLDSYDPESAESGHEFRDLADKFLIGVCDGRVEIHDLLFTMAKELVEATADKSRLLLSNCAELRNKEGRDKVRGIVLDMSKMEEMPLKKEVFVGMSSLRYLKVYNSLCPPHSETECKLNLPDGLEFPKHNAVRYFHWVKFPGTELPSDFDPNNLIDLRLPYSNIITVWSRYKVAPNLKWVDLSHSSNLNSLMGLLKAPNLLRLNLEGCTSLKELPDEMKYMTNLVFLNLRGCTSLLSLPKITMESLKTLILSGCSKLQTFEVISERLESLYLNGTLINGLPPAIGNLHRLILLNLKDCKNLATLPDCLGELKSLQELKLSRCSELKMFPDVKKKVESLRVLLLDGTSIAEMPGNIFDFSLLQRLCLSRNDNIRTLRFDMGQMFHLKWLELKCCKNLTSLPIIPPNLQCLNAHGCTSLRTVASPQTLPTPTEQIHSTFIFTNCHELEQVSKNAIISYVQKKSKLMSADRYNQDFVFKSLIGTCFPGCEIPAWFNHQSLGSVLTLELPQDWNAAGKIIGIALCVVVSFKEYRDQNNSLQVKCTWEFTNVSLSPESFMVGGWSEPGDETHTVESDHTFIGYTSLLTIKNRQQFPSATEISLGFQVTNGTSEVEKCKVIKCGFSLVYEPNEANNTSWKETPRMEDNRQDRRSSFKTGEGDDCPSATPTTADSNKGNGFLSSLWRDISIKKKGL